MPIVERAPTPTLEVREAVQVRANPVDTYVRPPEPAKSGLWDLAAGLENFSRDIRGMAQARKARDEEGARLRGEAAFLQDNKTGMAEGVRRGLIPSFESPAFMEGYKGAQGKLAGAQMASRMAIEYQTWEGRNSQDPANYDAFVADFLKRNLTTQDPDVLRGLLPAVYSAVGSGYNQRTQEAADSVYLGGLTSQVAVGSLAVDAASENAMESGGAIDLDALWGNLITVRGDSQGMGIRTADFDKNLVDMIAAKALEYKDPSILSLLDRTLPGSEQPLSAEPYGRTVKANSINTMESAASSAASAAYTQQERRDKELKETFTAYAIKALSEDPNHVFPAEFMDQYSKVSPTALVDIQGWRNGVQGEEDPVAIADLTARIAIGGENAMAVINGAMQTGERINGPTITRLMELGTQEAPWARNAQYKQGIASIKSAASQGLDLGFLGPDFSNQAMTDATLDYYLSMSAWAAANPEMANNPAAIATEAKRVQDVIMGGFALEDGEAAASYTQPQAIEQTLEGAGLENLVGDTQRAETLSDRVNQVLTETDPSAGLSQVGGLADLTPEEQDMVRAFAQQNGNMDPELLVEAMKGELPALLQEMSQPVPDPAAQVPNQVNAFLDWIANAEGTGGNYNETFGFGRFTGGDQDLTNMTLAQVRALQDQMLMDPGNSWNSSAVGKYQTVGATLGDAMTALNLDPTQTYSPEVQDQVGEWLLNRRGFKEWQDGTLSDEDFMKNLSTEWTSLKGMSLPVARQAVTDTIEGLSNGPNPDIIQAGLSNGRLNDNYGIGAAIDAAMKGGSHLQVAARFLNMREDNSQEAATLAAFFKKSAGVDLNPANTAWCAAFVNAVLGESGKGGTGSNLARSFLNYGEDVMGTPQGGDIIVFPRGNSGWQGHVGFVSSTFQRDGETWVKVLGGNQSDSVSFSEYKLSDALGVRRPTQTTIVASN